MINRFWWERAAEIALTITISCVVLAAWVLLDMAGEADFDAGIFLFALFTGFGTLMNMTVTSPNISAQTSVSIALGGTRREALMGIQLLKLFAPLVIFAVAACACIVLYAELLPLIPVCLAIALVLSAVSGIIGILIYRKRTLGSLIMGIMGAIVGGFAGFASVYFSRGAEAGASLAEFFSAVNSVSVYIWLAAALLYILSVVLESRMLRRFEVKL